MEKNIVHVSRKQDKKNCKVMDLNVVCDGIE